MTEEGSQQYLELLKGKLLDDLIEIIFEQGNLIDDYRCIRSIIIILHWLQNIIKIHMRTSEK